MWQKGGEGCRLCRFLMERVFPVSYSLSCVMTAPPAPARIMMSTCRLGCFLGGGGGGKGGNCFQKMNDANDGFIV